MIAPPGRLVLLGHPVSHSLSPLMQNAALGAAGIPLRYETLDVEPACFDETLMTLREARAAGNVTVPHKERMFRACDELTPLARRVGAANVFWVGEAEKLVGDNTDVGGFLAAATQLLGTSPRDITIGVYGAGGAAAAVLAAIENCPGCFARVYNRTPERARLLCERFRDVARAVDDVGAVAGAQLVVNATAIGLTDRQLPIDIDLIPRDSCVMDLIPKRGGSAWVDALQQRGTRAFDGIPMLVEQAALAFEQWFALTPDRLLMRHALDEH